MCIFSPVMVFLVWPLRLSLVALFLKQFPVVGQHVGMIYMSVASVQGAWLLRRLQYCRENNRWELIECIYENPSMALREPSLTCNR